MEESLLHGCQVDVVWTGDQIPNMHQLSSVLFTHQSSVEIVFLVLPLCYHTSWVHRLVLAVRLSLQIYFTEKVVTQVDRNLIMLQWIKVRVVTINWKWLEICDQTSSEGTISLLFRWLAINNSVEPVRMGYKLFCNNAKFNMIGSQTSNVTSRDILANYASIDFL